MSGGWDLATLRARVSDPAGRVRYPAGSPDVAEIEAYDAGIGRCPRAATALVLGMTPELRRLALRRFDRVVSVDANQSAIELYRDWVEPYDRQRESIVCADWFRYLAGSAERFDAILGDGIFGNLPGMAEYERLLGLISRSLRRSGHLLTRMALIPRAFDPDIEDWRKLLERFRNGELDEAEFGFGVRLVGHFHCCYDTESFTLNNPKLFAECERARSAGELNAAEHAAIRRYYYGGTNLIPSQQAWEDLLGKTGFSFRIQRCSGKTWYGYYPVYRCHAKEVPC